MQVNTPYIECLGMEPLLIWNTHLKPSETIGRNCGKLMKLMLYKERNIASFQAHFFIYSLDSLGLLFFMFTPAKCGALRIIGPSKTGYFEDPNPATQVQTLPLEGPRSLGGWWLKAVELSAYLFNHQKTSTLSPARGSGGLASGWRIDGCCPKPWGFWPGILGLIRAMCW